MTLYDHEEINGTPVSEFIFDAANSFTRAALDDVRWAGDHEGTGANPLDLGAHSWEPVSSYDVRGAYHDEADSPETQVENALSDRAIEIIETLDISPCVFGDRLYYDQNGAGTGFWDMDFSRPEYRELSDLTGYHEWGLEYSYDTVNDPDGNDVDLSVTS